MAEPCPPVGMNSLSFQEMISEIRPRGLQARDHRVGEADQLDAVIVHDAAPAKNQAFGELQADPPLDQASPRFVRSERRHIVDPEIAQYGRDLHRRNVAADDPFAGIGLDPVDLAVMIGQPPPDRQEEPCDDVERAGGELRNRSHFGVPEFTEQLPVGGLPMGFGKGVETKAQFIGRPQQAHAVLDGSVVEHQARRRQLDRCTVRARVDQQN